MPVVVIKYFERFQLQEEPVVIRYLVLVLSEEYLLNLVNGPGMWLSGLVSIVAHFHSVEAL